MYMFVLLHCVEPSLVCFFLFFLSETMEKKLVEETKQLELDLNDERLRYQNLLNEFSRLEERYDDLKEEMTLMVVSQMQFLMEKYKHIQKYIDYRMSSPVRHILLITQF